MIFDEIRFFLNIWKDYKTDKINNNSTEFKIYINLEHFSNDDNKYQWRVISEYNTKFITQASSKLKISKFLDENVVK